MSLKQPLSSITLNMLLVGFSRVIVQCWYLPKDSNHQTYLLCVMHLYRQWHWQQQGHSCKLTDLQGTGSALHSSNGEVFPRCSCSYFLHFSLSQAPLWLCRAGRCDGWAKAGTCSPSGVPHPWSVTEAPVPAALGIPWSQGRASCVQDSEFHGTVAMAGRTGWLVTGVVKVCYLFPL